MGSHAALSLVSGGAGFTARAGERHRTLLCATIATTTNQYPIKLRDLSADGAMIEGDRIPHPGTDILIRRGALEMLATVIWVKDHRAGLKFEESLSDGEVWGQINPPPPTSVAADPAVYRPGFHGDQVKAEERAIARARQLAAARKFLARQ